jgi:hypothetical protein
MVVIAKYAHPFIDGSRSLKPRPIIAPRPFF